MPTLILNFPEGETTTCEVVGDIVTVGRARHNHIVIGERHVSSLHAEFRRRVDRSYELVDLGSLNGTYVNGVRLTERHGLHEGDRIVFGLTECKLLHSSAERAGSEDQLTRGIEIDFLRAAEALRLNPDLAHAAVELQKQIDQAKVSLGERQQAATGHPHQEEAIRELQRKLEEANAKLASLQSNAPRPAPTPTPTRGPIPVAMPAPPPPRHPTLHMVSPGRSGRSRQVTVESHTPVPSHPKPADRAPDAFLPAQPALPPATPPDRKSPFSVAPPEGLQSNGHPGNGAYGLNGQATPPPRQGPRTPWKTLLSPHRPRPDDHES